MLFAAKVAVFIPGATASRGGTDAGAFTSNTVITDTITPAL